MGAWGVDCVNTMTYPRRSRRTLGCVAPHLLRPSTPDRVGPRECIRVRTAPIRPRDRLLSFLVVSGVPAGKRSAGVWRVGQRSVRGRVVQFVHHARSKMPKPQRARPAPPLDRGDLGQRLVGARALRREPADQHGGATAPRRVCEHERALDRPTGDDACEPVGSADCARGGCRGAACAGGCLVRRYGLGGCCSLVRRSSQRLGCAGGRAFYERCVGA
mmetsp:Transcript_24980/g.78769  ORF Transcript_24980/g.78769 Transcript_24980/m.78769 type:complete len:217 (+) Transcript_24980:1659-2309(+)|eukprot:scaffold555_cov109-Isochrysis_galbana.AAC.13